MLPAAQQAEIFAAHDPIKLKYDWGYWGRPSQQLPAGDDWTILALISGRGFGKTRAGAEAVRRLFRHHGRGIMVGRTISDVRDQMVEGPAGVLACSPPGERPEWKVSKKLLRWANGAVCQCFSADEPDALRGPQCGWFWADELATWKNLNDPLNSPWGNLKYGFRMGKHIHGIVTSTPRPTKAIKELLASPDAIVRRGSTFENIGNLSSQYYRTVIAPMIGTRQARQEIFGELLEDVEGALWTHTMLDAARMAEGEQLPDMRRVVVGVDPAVTAHEDSDATGIAVVGIGADSNIYILADRTIRTTPKGWAFRVRDAVREFKADRVVGEVNNGGDLVEANLRSVAPNLPYRSVRASRGKVVRAEPVAALYEQGHVRHPFGRGLADLEDELLSFTVGGYVGDRSPDRSDAMIWAVTELVLSEHRTEQYATLYEPQMISPI